MDRKRDDGRRPPRDDIRNHKSRYEQERSRSPPRRDRRDDRRRDRSPQTQRIHGPSSRGGPPARADRDREIQQRGRGGARPPRDPPDNKSGNTVVSKREEKKDIKMEDIPEDEDEEAAMQRLMGFKGFKTTKNTKVPGNDRNYGVSKVKKVEYRQYMNRVGGFNRPLSPSRT
ncbi:Hypothetical predicted protein [Lecanosticta acicola]|uniref:U4/U6.U5 small nuclear ribonucleoprotein 27kDa protein domain-containing protein n=1 Tax=Lecanosticta acicola TaxID=111012 RepID=A0AAI9EE13_9PEZI|nr:Hypothetical predicted protein [Lecanosticta acicola]